MFLPRLSTDRTCDIFFCPVAVIRLRSLTVIRHISWLRLFRPIYCGATIGWLLLLRYDELRTHIVCTTSRTQHSSSSPHSSDNWVPPYLPRNCRGFEAINTAMVAHAISGIIVDVILVALPIWIVYTKMLFSRKTVQVMFVFSVGFFVIATGIVRLVLIKTTDFSQDSYVQTQAPSRLREMWTIGLLLTML